MDTSVASVFCDSYDEKTVDAAVRRTLDLLGGIGSFVRPGMTVLVKPNLLAGTDPEKAVTTHPAVIGAVARILIAHGCTVLIGDSPGAGVRYTPASLRRAYRRSGITPLGDIPGVSLNYDVSHTTRGSPDGRVVKRFLIISPAATVDAIITISKPKTHLLTTYTGAVKNLFGLIPGHEKSLFHTRFPEAEGFSEMLIDLHGAVCPVLHLMDAVTGMEGNGPMSGKPRDIGLILGSTDPHALDYVVSSAIGIPPESIPTITAAERRGLLPSAPLILGDDPASLRIAPFRLPDTKRPAGLRMKIMRKILARLQHSGRIITPYPGVIPSACIGCGACERICPVDAVTLKNRVAEIDLSLCIRCYCCHESCEAAAIGIRDSLLSRLLFGNRQ